MSLRAGDVVVFEGDSFVLAVDEVNGRVFGRSLHGEQPRELVAGVDDVALARVATDEARVTALKTTVEMQAPGWQRAAECLRVVGAEVPQVRQGSLFG